jgi:hypothetical protein
MQRRTVASGATSLGSAADSWICTSRAVQSRPPPTRGERQPRADTTFDYPRERVILHARHTTGQLGPGSTRNQQLRKPPLQRATQRVSRTTG